MSFWGAKVITNLFSAIPFVGNTITTWLWGGYSVDNPTLNRFFSLHYLLPFVLAGVVALHIWALHVPGNNNPTGISVRGPQDTVPFHPYYTLKDGFAVLVFLFVYALFVFYGPNYLGDAVNYTQANPLATPAHIKPEWYTCRSTPSCARSRTSFWVSLRCSRRSSSCCSCRGSIRHGCARASTVRSSSSSSGCSASSAWRWLHRLQAAGRAYVVWGQILTVYYFAHFIILLPLMGLLETPKQVPNSISEDVLVPQAAE